MPQQIMIIYFWNFAFAYGGRAEIVDAAKIIAGKLRMAS